tara:strand:- start:5591 stop:6097 length:507 start_codon:yes stop_codon:yes gene_type:complete
MAKEVVYSGTFDPVTRGHLNILKRSVSCFDVVHVLIAKNPAKKCWFSSEERKKMILSAACEEFSENDFDRVKVHVVDGLITDWMRKNEISVIVRGLRAVSDYEYELQMSLMNSQLLKGCETIFMVADSKWSFVSSRLIKEVALLGGDFSKQVPASILENIKKRIQEKD